MGYNFSDDFLDELHQKNPIDAIVGEYITLNKRGRLFTGLCPFHNEKTPSFTVYPDTDSFFCFGCGAGGEVITFIRRMQNLDFIEAVKLLADRAGMRLPTVADDGFTILRRKIYEANREAARFYNTLLYQSEGEEQLAYLKKRGVSDQMITRFGLGAAPDAWRVLYEHLHGAGFSDEVLVAANLIRKSEKNGKSNYYDTFRSKVIYPVVDVRGNVIAFGSRVLDNSKPKYINSSDTPVYKKSNELYALNLAKNDTDGSLILCEGYMDVIALHSAGFTNAVAGLGTALTAGQISLISRYAKEVYICYDSDEAGQKATVKALSLFAETGVKVKVIAITGGKDPDDIIREQGKERFKALLEGSDNDIEFKLNAERGKFDLKTADGKIGFLKAAAVILAVNGGAIEHDIYASRLSDELSVGKDAVLQQIKLVNTKSERARLRNALRDAEKTREKLYENVLTRGGGNFRTVRAQEVLLVSLLKNPGFFSKLEDKLTVDLFITPLYRRVFELIGDRIASNAGLDMAFIAQEFSPDEMGRIVKLYAPDFPVSNTLKECEDCIAALLEQDKPSDARDVSTLSDEDFLSLFKKENK